MGRKNPDPVQRYKEDHECVFTAKETAGLLEVSLSTVYSNTARPAKKGWPPRLNMGIKKVLFLGRDVMAFRRNTGDLQERVLPRTNPPPREEPKLSDDEYRQDIIDALRPYKEVADITAIDSYRLYPVTNWIFFHSGWDGSKKKRDPTRQTPEELIQMLTALNEFFFWRREMTWGELKSSRPRRAVALKLVVNTFERAREAGLVDVQA